MWPRFHGPRSLCSLRHHYLIAVHVVMDEWTWRTFGVPLPGGYPSPQIGCPLGPIMYVIYDAVDHPS